jgi:Cu(I)/Ag(I) efflux system membrane protein CusA/SilA
MMVYLDLALRRYHDEGLIHSRLDLTAAITVGASHLIRPLLMTGLALFMGLVPIMYSTGSGADMMKRIAAPLLGGIGSALVMVLIVFPAIFSFWRGRGLPAVVGEDTDGTGAEGKTQV